MGVKKLWHAAGEPKKGSLAQFRGSALPIGVDGPNVVHPFARRHAVELAQGRWEPYALQVLKMFQKLQRRAGVKLLVVFDVAFEGETSCRNVCPASFLLV